MIKRPRPPHLDPPLSSSSEGEDADVVPASPSPTSSYSNEEGLISKRIRRHKPLDMEKHLPIVMEGVTAPEEITVLMTMPGQPIVDDMEGINTATDFINLLDSLPDTNYVPGRAAVFSLGPEPEGMSAR